MNTSFRSQTTELVTLHPLKGTGKINDRLRFDVTGLVAPNTYLLTYDPATSAFSWQNVDSAGVDTLYSADGTISVNRTITLDSSADLDIVGSPGSEITISTINGDEVRNMALEMSAIFALGGDLDDAPYSGTTYLNLSPATTTNNVPVLEISGTFVDGDQVLPDTVIQFLLTAFNYQGLSYIFEVNDNDNDISTSSSIAWGQADHSLRASFINNDTEISTEMSLDMDPESLTMGIALASEGAGAAGLEQAMTVAITNNEDGTGSVLSVGTDSVGGSFTVELSNSVSNFSGNIDFGEDNAGLQITVVDPDVSGTFTFRGDEASILCADTGSGEEANLTMDTGDGIELAYTGLTYSHSIALQNLQYIQINEYRIARGTGGLTGIGNVDIDFVIPDIGNSYNFIVQVVAYCTDAGNGIGLTTNEAFVGWYGVGVNNTTGIPALIGTGQALGTAQADAGMADAAFTFTVSDDPDTLHVNFAAPSTAGTTSTFVAKATVKTSE